MPLSRKIILDSGNGQTFNEPWERIAGDYTAQVGDRLLLDARTTSPIVTLPSEGLTNGDSVSLMIVRDTGTGYLFSSLGIDSGHTAVLSATDLALAANYSGNDGKWLLAGASASYRQGRPATYTASSAYGANPGATDVILTNGLTDRGWATNNNAGDDWIRIDLFSAKSLTNCRISAGSDPNLGGLPGYLNGYTLEVSLDAQSWTTIATLSGFTTSGTGMIQNFSLVGRTARYAQIRGASNVAASEFWVI